MAEVEQAVSPVNEDAQPDPSLEGQSTSPGTVETVAETDEQKNERELAERQKRSDAQKTGIQRRFNELTAEKHAERQRAEAAERRLDTFLAQQQGQRQAPQQPSSNAPTREQFQTYEDFVEAKAAHKATEAAKAQVDQYMRAQQEQGQRVYQQQAVEQIFQSHQQRVAEFAKATPDFNEVVDREDINIPDPHAMILMSRPDSEKIIYAIGQNPKLAQEISKAPNVVELGVILGRISASLATSPQISKAPQPGKPVGARGGAVSNDPSDDDSMDAWLKKRNAQLRR